MEAKTLQSKKKVNKGKLKKAMKYVISRPDPVCWPELSEDHGEQLRLALVDYKVEVPVFEKLHWNELKSIPKEKRPKPPPIKSVDGLIFGIAATTTALKDCKCSAVIIEASVNPRAIVQPVIEECVTTRTPIICMKNLKKISLEYFRISTSCLAIEKDKLQKLKNVVSKISQSYKTEPHLEDNSVNMDVDVKNELLPTTVKETNTVEVYPYLYRKDKNTRVFVPGEAVIQKKFEFSGQDYINFSDKKNEDSKKYMKMIIKKISSNPNRVQNK